MRTSNDAEILMSRTVLTSLAVAGALIILVGAPAVAQTLSPMESLGKALFFDSNLSTPPGQSCAACHDPATGFTGPDSVVNAGGAVSEGAVHNRFGARRPPTVAYADAPLLHYDGDRGVWVGGSFWDGRATGWTLGDPLAEQAIGPFLNNLEQNFPHAKQVVRRVARSAYAQLFEEVWGSGSIDDKKDVAATYERIGRSIAAYERSAEVMAFTSKFDAYWRASLAAGNDPEDVGLARGDKSVLDPEGILTEQEFAGLIEFGEYCAACHTSTRPGPGGTPPQFTDFSYHNIGVPKNPENPFYFMPRLWNPDGADFVDYGLGDFLKSAGYPAEVYEMEFGKQKVPTVRNVDFRPYAGFHKAFMHNGSLKSLEEVVHFYNTRDVLDHWPPPEYPGNLNDELFEGLPIGDFQLTAEAEAAVVAFLRTLNDGYSQ
jgi:cytochrome c peroxidase